MANSFFATEVRVMDVETPFSEKILNAVSTALLEADVPNIVTGFLLVTEFIDDDGDIQLSVTHPADQSSARTLGYAAYGTEWIRDDVRTSFDMLHGFGE